VVVVDDDDDDDDDVIVVGVFDVKFGMYVPDPQRLLAA
jgi:hypothetical protein